MHIEISQIAVKIGCEFVEIRAAAGTYTGRLEYCYVGVPRFFYEICLSHPPSDTDFGQVHFLKARCRRSKKV